MAPAAADRRHGDIIGVRVRVDGAAPAGPSRGGDVPAAVRPAVRARAAAHRNVSIRGWVQGEPQARDTDLPNRLPALRKSRTQNNSFSLQICHHGLDSLVKTECEMSGKNERTNTLAKSRSRPWGRVQGQLQVLVEGPDPCPPP